MEIKMTNQGSLIFYIIIFLLSVFLFSQYRNKNKLFGELCVFLSLIILSVVAALRYEVGTDWGNYNWDMSYLRNIPFIAIVQGDPVAAKLEIGYVLLVKLLSLFFNNNWIFGIIAYITLAFVADALIKQYSNYDVTLSYMMFVFIYFANSFNIMRQTLAAAIVFWGMQYVFAKKPIKYATIIFISSLIHLSAVFAIPIYFFWNKRNNCPMRRKTFLLIASIAFLFVISWRKLLSVIIYLLPGSFVQKYWIYLGNNNARNRDFFVKLFVFIVILLLNHCSKMKNEKNRIFIQMGAINLILAITGFYLTFFKRCGLYYEMPIIVLIGAIEKGFVKQSKSVVNIAIGLAIIVYFIVLYYMVGSSEIIPYQIKI